MLIQLISSYIRQLWRRAASVPSVHRGGGLVHISRTKPKRRQERRILLTLPEWRSYKFLSLASFFIASEIEQDTEEERIQCLPPFRGVPLVRVTREYGDAYIPRAVQTSIFHKRARARALVPLHKYNDKYARFSKEETGTSRSFLFAQRYTDAYGCNVLHEARHKNYA